MRVYSLVIKSDNYNFGVLCESR